MNPIDADLKASGSRLRGVLPDGPDHLFIVVEAVNRRGGGHEHHSHQSGPLHTLAGGGACASAEQQRTGRGHHRLAQLVAEVPVRQEHSRPVLAGLDGVVLGQIGEHGRRDDIGDCDGKGDDQSNQDGEHRAANTG